MAKLSIPKNLFVPLKQLFIPGKTLLVPMLLLAVGFHAILLSLPLPSTEEQKTPDDQKNPIKITQIPTEKRSATAASASNVSVPPLGKTTVSDSTTSSESSSSTDASTDTSTSDSDSSTAEDDAAPTDDTSSTSTVKSAIAPTKPAKPTSNKAAASESKSGNAEDSKRTSADANGNSAANESALPLAAASPPSSESAHANSTENPFASFPHYQPSKSDCYGLGFGDNCRVVENGAIAQVADFFRKELTAKQFTVNVVINEPARKVYKVSKDNRTLFLNIWQANQSVAYLLAGVVYKQPLEAIKTELP